MKGNLMSRLGLMGALALGAAGCTTSRSPYASTNTLPVAAGQQVYSFKPSNLGQLVTSDETYFVMPMDTTKALEVNGEVANVDELLTKTKGKVLPVLFVPYSQSETVRLQDKVTYKPTGPVFIAINCFVDSTGALQPTPEDCKAPKNSYFPLATGLAAKLADCIQKDSRGITQQTAMPLDVRTEGLAVIQGQRFYSLPTTQCNTDSPHRVLIPVAAATPLQTEKRAAGKATEYSYGIDGPGYFFVKATVKDKVQPTASGSTPIKAEPSRVDTEKKDAKSQAPSPF